MLHAVPYTRTAQFLPLFVRSNEFYSLFVFCSMYFRSAAASRKINLSKDDEQMFENEFECDKFEITWATNKIRKIRIRLKLNTIFGRNFFRDI